jgi:hypothetical protein
MKKSEGIGNYKAVSDGIGNFGRNEDPPKSFSKKSRAKFLGVIAGTFFLVFGSITATVKGSPLAPSLTGLVGLAAMVELLVCYHRLSSMQGQIDSLGTDLTMSQIDMAQMVKRLKSSDKEAAQHLDELDQARTDLKEAEKEKQGLYEFALHSQAIATLEGIELVKLGQQMKLLRGRDFSNDPQSASRLNTIFRDVRWISVRAAVRTVSQLQGKLEILTKQADPDVFTDVAAKLMEKKLLPFEIEKYRETVLIPFMAYANKGIAEPISFPGSEAKRPALRIVTPTEDEGDDSEEDDLSDMGDIKPSPKNRLDDN